MIEGAPHLHATIDGAPAADKYIDEFQAQAKRLDANDVLYSLESSADYDPQPRLRDIRAKVFALNFSDDEFNPDELEILETLMPHVAGGRYAVQPATPTSFGHLTMAHPELWAGHVAEFMQWLDQK